MFLALDKQGALYDQIARAIKLLILEGRVLAGSKLPSTRRLAATLGVSRKSVVQAYDLLCAEGLATARECSGTRVAKASSRGVIATKVGAVSTSLYAVRLKSLPSISLAGGANANGRPRYDLLYGEPQVDSSLLRSWRRKLSAAALRSGLTYPQAGGHLPLRQAIANYLGRRRGLICEASDILVVGGTQQALTIVERVLLDSGDRVIVEDPHYQFALHSLLAHGAQVTRCKVDQDGLIVSELPSQRTRLTFVTPSHQFPSGAVMSLARRLELLKWADHTGSWIFEDDYDSEFHSGEKPVPALRTLDPANRVLYVGSFSKTLFPSLRLGYIVCPKTIRDDLYRAKLMDDLGSPAMEQVALGAFIESGQYEKHLRNSMRVIANRRRTLVDGLRRVAGSLIEIGPHQAGMHFLIWLRNLDFDRFDSLLERARSIGLGLHPVHPYYHTRPSRPGLLIGYASLSVGQLRNAVELFSRCVAMEH
jgi:GntR family transcriptional regulator / MocR family aminotransferase